MTTMNPNIRFFFNKVWGLGVAVEMFKTVGLDDVNLNSILVTHTLHAKILVMPLLIVLDIPLWITEDESLN